MIQLLRWFLLLLLVSTLSGCFYWVRAYQTYLQMDEFDQNFEISIADEFNVHFKDPILYNHDFISLSKLKPSEIIALESGEKWRYWFIKVDEHDHIIQPEIKFYFDLTFNSEDRLIRWAFSSLFLQIAPAEFLELSFRSLGSATINKEKRQLKANADLFEKITSELPKKSQVLSQLGEPLKIKQEKKEEKYRYHFLLQTDDIEQGYEDRSLNVVKLTFDKTTRELIKMAGRFAGLKISIDYREYLENSPEQLAQAITLDK